MVVLAVREEFVENVMLQAARGGASMVGRDSGLCRLIDLEMGY